MRTGLNWIKDHYNNVPVYITENGVSDDTGELDDTWRIEYYRAYIDEMLKGTWNKIPVQTKYMYPWLP